MQENVLFLNIYIKKKIQNVVFKYNAQALYYTINILKIQFRLSLSILFSVVLKYILTFIIYL